MRPFLPLLPLLLLSAQAAPSVFVAYPPDGHRLPYSHVILEGSVTPGATLKVSGQAVPVGPDGLYTLWWPLKLGLNDLSLVATQGGQSARTTLRVTRVAETLPITPTVIRPGSAQPSGRVEFWDPAGDSPAERTFEVGFTGSPGGRASFQVGGGPSQPLPEREPGQYRGEFTLPLGITFDRAEVKLSLTGQDGRTVSVTAPGRLSTGTGPATATQLPQTVRGLGTNEAEFSLTDLAGAPLLYPREGMTFLAVGRLGDDVRVRLAPGQSALVADRQVALGKGVPAPVWPGRVSLDGVSESGGLPALPFTPPPVGAPGFGVGSPGEPLRIRLPLGGARVPFRLEQGAGGQRLSLTLYGVSAPPELAGLSSPLLNTVNLTAAPGLARLDFEWAAAQGWGFQANYEGPDLVLSVRRSPALDPARPLLGRTLVIDPGHGGSNRGGAGVFRIPEKDLILPVGLRVAQLLRERGAKVELTRDRDQFVGLTERNLLAEEVGADLLVSLHYNALPDGRDPRGVRGPEVYYTHPQAEAPAAAILARLRRDVPELGVGAGLKPGANLALTRPSTQPSLLVELAYLTDASNIRLLHSPEGQERLAQAVAAGLEDFYAAQRLPAPAKPGQGAPGSGPWRLP